MVSSSGVSYTEWSVTGATGGPRLSPTIRETGGFAMRQCLLRHARAAFGRAFRAAAMLGAVLTVYALACWTYRFFLFVGIAYFLTAVLAPLFLLMGKGAAFSGYTSAGSIWSLVAGIAGAIGAFGVLLAFGAKGSPSVVMSIVFAGAPVLNALVSLYMSRHEINFGTVNPLFLQLAAAMIGIGSLYGLWGVGRPDCRAP